ncbi:hypothetical protein M409DRAFT_61909 [Zasmidium cellare ATCC 36951]|uniref:O-methyltransferase C-terminal domain-containing protein n=1 Tax=Zasmidium cellare ATCC 36951 TaxID=1080233 RepID=A0A6A6D5W8_ZASCE|nr:uncharacterized protein M409DRAFT_61909 [Zasmidium cellare ATCC 36951]KAF2173539.1 hypothetical protein M409DRAFT_61909 [Zasmidium cellare ATCC 36951]
MRMTVPLQTSAARIGHDLEIFQTLAVSGPKTLEQLQKQTNAHPLTLGRLLRYMASVGMIDEPNTNLFAANKKCKNLANASAVTIVTHFFENCSPLFQEMPAFLSSKKYGDITDGKDTVFQPAYGTHLDTYSWFAQNEINKDALIKYMAMEQSVRGRWLDQYPFERESQGLDADKPVFVDVGGNVGHYCALFRTRFPNIPDRVILQDLQSTVAHAMQTPGVEVMGHDFFQDQPTKGSKYYHLGWILHNWNDAKSADILRQIKSAMNAQFRLFLASLDLVMLGACGSRERTVKEWEELLGDVGLAIKERIMYNHELCHGIICATLA